MNQDEIIKRLEARIARLEAQQTPARGTWHESKYPDWLESLRPVGAAMQKNKQVEDDDDWGGLMSGVLFRD